MNGVKLIVTGAAGQRLVSEDEADAVRQLSS
jgi:hypothetical protein